MPAPMTRSAGRLGFDVGTADALVADRGRPGGVGRLRDVVQVLVYRRGLLAWEGLAAGSTPAEAAAEERPRAPSHRGRFDPRAVSLAAAVAFGLLLASTHGRSCSRWPRSSRSPGLMSRPRQLRASHRAGLLRGARRRRPPVRARRRARPRRRRSAARLRAAPPRAGGHLAARGGGVGGPARGGATHARQGCDACPSMPEAAAVLDSLGSERRLAAGGALAGGLAARRAGRPSRSSTPCSEWVVREASADASRRPARPAGGCGRGLIDVALVALAAVPALALASLRAGRRARRDEQVVEDRRRQPRLEHRAVERLERQVAAVGVLAPGHGTPSGSAVASSVRFIQPNQVAASSSPRTRTSLEAGAARVSRRASPGVNACTSTSHSSLSSSRAVAALRSVARRGAASAPATAAPARRAPRFGTCEQVAVARRLAAEGDRAAGPQHAPELGNAASRSGRWWSTAWPKTRSNDSSANGSLSASQPTVSHVERRARAAELDSRLEHAGRDVGGHGLADHAGAQQVEREVAGAGADLERALVVRRARAPSALRELADHLRLARARRSRCPTWRRSRAAARSW